MSNDLLEKIRKERDVWCAQQAAASAAPVGNGAVASTDPVAQIRAAWEQEKLRRKQDAPKKAQELMGLLQNWNNGYNQVVTDYTGRFQGRTGGYMDGYMADTADALTAFQSRKEALKATEKQIEDLLYIYGDYMNQEAVDGLRQQLRQGKKSLDEIGEVYSGTDAFYKQFKDEADYEAQAEYGRYAEKYSGMDYDALHDAKYKLDPHSSEYAWLDKYYLSTVEKEKLDEAIASNNREIDSLLAFMDEYAGLELWYNDYVAGNVVDSEAEIREKLAMHKAIIERFGSYAGMSTMVRAKKAETERLEEMKKYAWLSENPDFKKYAYSGFTGDAVPSSLFDEFDKDQQYYLYINDMGGVRERMTHMGGDNAFSHLDYMTPEEIANYNYLYNTQGKKAATAYLESDTLADSLNRRVGDARFERMKGNTGKELLFAVQAGLDQFGSGVKNFFNTEDYYIPATATQYAAAKVREDLADDGAKLPDWLGGSSLGQVGFDAISTVSNMAPSILASSLIGLVNPAAGTVVGSGLMGLGAAGNAYTEMLNAGYSPEEARLYGISIGVSEVVMERALGGISKLGGNTLSKTALKNLADVDNVLARFAKSAGGKLLASAGSEALEEGLQTILEPYLRYAVSQENVEITADMQEALYSALMGFATGGLFEAADPNTYISEGGRANPQSVENGSSVRQQPTQQPSIDPARDPAAYLESIVPKPADPGVTSQPDAEIQKNAVSEETTVTVTSGPTAITEKNRQDNTLAYTLATNIDQISDMESVSSLTGRELNDRGRTITEQIADFFKSIGNKIFRNGFGNVELGEYGIASMINHRPVNRARIVSVAAAPDVIKNGRQISYDPSWKGRGYPSYIFAAPVTVNGTKVYVAAVVNKRPDNKFYLSEMVDSEGNYVRIEESPSGNAKNGVTDGAREPGKAGITVRPEGLSEGDNLSAPSAEPTSLFNPIIRTPAQTVNPSAQENVSAPSAGVANQSVADYLASIVPQPAHAETVSPVDTVAQTDYDNSQDVAAPDSMDIIDSVLKKGVGILYNGGRSVKLSAREYAAVTSRISTNYYYSNTEHEGVQCIERSTDGKNAKLYLYLYKDHGFGTYEIIGRINYSQNDEMIRYLKEAINYGNQVDRTAEGVSERIDRLQTVDEHPVSGRSGDRHGQENSRVLQTTEKGNGQRETGDKWSGRPDFDGHDDGGAGVTRSNPDDNSTFGPNTVGSAQSKFDHRVERSNLYTNPQTNYNNTTSLQGGNSDANIQQQGGSIYPGGVRRNSQTNLKGEVTGSGSHGRTYAPVGNQGGSFFGGDGKNVHTQDSEGRALTQAQASRLQNTSVVDENGAPIAVYHSTNNPHFITFEKGDTGFHFGTADQAARLAEQRAYTNGRMFRVYLDLKNPYHSSRDIMGWNPPHTALLLWSDGVLTEQDYKEILDLWKLGDGYDSSAAVRLREMIEDKGYDGISYPNGFEGNGLSYMAFYDNQIIRSEITPFSNSFNSSADITDGESPAPNAVGAAPAWFDPTTRLQYEYGTIPEGENPVRPDDLPKRDYTGQQVSYTARTVKGAEVTPDDFVDLLNRETVDGGLSYITITNSEATQAAMEFITAEGWEAARALWSADVRAGKVSAKMSATGALLLNNAAKAGDRTAWLDILHDYQAMGTNAAQATQALRILKTLQPSDKLYMIERSVAQIAKDIGGSDIRLDPKLISAYEEAQNDAQRDAVLDKIQQSVADQLPASLMEQWTALRYVNMLGNLRTQVRNVAGNVTMQAVNSVKNTISAAMEHVAYAASGGNFRRTKSFTVSKELLASCRQYFAGVKSLAMGSRKFSDQSFASDFEQGVQDKRTIFRFKPLEAYRKATNAAMDGGDKFFSERAFARSLAGYLKANGFTGTDLSMADTALMDDALAYAVKEAQEVTFRDNNALSTWVSKIGRRKDTPWYARVISEGTVPFRKTPANILVRAEEYSPLGLVNSLYKSTQKIVGETSLAEKNGALGDFARAGSQLTGAELIDSWAKTLTGSGLFALGMLLSNLGVLSAGPDDDEKQEAFDQLNGQQNYAIKIGDVSLTIDWMSPAAVPVLMGAQLWELMQEDGIQFKGIESALLSLADPMIEMSMLQGLNDTLDNVKYSDSSIGQLVISTCLSYLTQGLTNTALGQIERSFQDSRTETYVDPESPLPNWLQRIVGSASAKTPGWDYNQIPYINAWGEQEENPPTALNLLYNTLSPSYYSVENDDAVSRELNRVYAASGAPVFPTRIGKTVTYNKAEHVLSADQYVSLQTSQGQTSRKIIEGLIAASAYAELSDQSKAKAIEYAYAYARETARIEVLEDYPGYSEKWMGEAASDPVSAILLKAYEYAQEQAGNRFNASRYDEMVAGGATDRAAKAAEAALSGLVPEGDYTNVRNIQKLEAIMDLSGLTPTDEEAALRAIMDDKLEAKYDTLTGGKYNLSNDDFVETYRAYLNNQKAKADAVAAIVKAVGCSKKQAEQIYQIYKGKSE